MKIMLLVLSIWLSSVSNASTFAIANFSSGKLMILIGQDGKLYSRSPGNAGWTQFVVQLPGGVKAKDIISDVASTDALLQQNPAAIYVIGSDGQLYRFTDGSDGFAMRTLELPNGVKPLAQ
jgi:hypothetical protein